MLSALGNLFLQLIIFYTVNKTLDFLLPTRNMYKVQHYRHYFIISTNHSPHSMFLPR